MPLIEQQPLRPVHPLPDVIRLPNTCPQNRKQYTHIQLLSSVEINTWHGVGFKGHRLKVGARICSGDLGADPVLLEFAGPQGTWKRGKHRQNLYILWRYDWPAADWREIARAESLDWSWALILREPAIRALHPRSREVLDFAIRGREVSDELLVTIDTMLARELPEVRAAVLTSIYDGVAGRIVAA